MKRIKAANLYLTCLLSLAVFGGFVSLISASGPPEMVTLVKESNTELRLYFDEPVQISGTYSSGFSLQDCNGIVYAVQSISDGTVGDHIIELTVADLTLASGDLSLTYFNLNGPISDLQGMVFDTDGIGVIVYSEDHFEIDNVTYDNNFFAPTENNDPHSFAFNDDGTKLYVLGLDNDATIDEYSLSTPYDISTSTYTNVSLNVEVQDGNPLNLFFSADGSILYLVGFSGNTIHTYDLSTNYDLSTAVYNTNFPVPVSGPVAATFNADGTQFYTLDLADHIRQFALTTPFDLSSLPSSTTGVPFFDTNLSTGISFSFNNNGTRLYTSDRNAAGVNQFELTTPYDVTTAQNGKSVLIGSTTNQVGTVTFSPDGSSLFALGTVVNKALYEFAVADVEAPTLTGLAKVSDTQVEVYFDETVAVKESFPNNFTVLKDGVAVQVDGISDGVVGDNKIKLLFSSPNDLSGASTSIVVTYADPTENGEIADLVCNTMADDAMGQTLTVETIAPNLISTELLSTAEMILYFDEPVQTTGLNASNFTVTHCDGTSGSAVTITDPNPLDNQLTIEIPDVLDFVVDYSVSYNDPGNQSVTDLFGNALANSTVQFSAANFDLGTLAYLGTEEELSLPPLTGGLYRSVAFNAAGDQITAGTSSGDLYQYNLAGPYDFSSISQVGAAVTLTGTNISSLKFSPTGDRVFYRTAVSGSNKLIQYDLGTPYDVNTTSNLVEVDPSEFGSFIGFTFSSVGDKLFVSRNRIVYEYSLSTPFDISTMTFVTNTASFSDLNATFPNDMAFVDNGNILLLMSSSRVFQIDQSTPYDASTMSFNDVEATIVGTGSSIAFNNTGSRVYFLDGNFGILRSYQLYDDTPPELTSIARKSQTEYTLIFSEAVAAKELTPASFTLNDGSNNIQATGISDNVLEDKQVDLIFPGTISSGGTFTITYDNSTNHDEVSDLACNAATTDATGVSIVVESVPPQIAYGRISSNNELTIYFDEPILLSGTATTSIFTLASCYGESISVNGIIDSNPADQVLQLTTDDLSQIQGDLSLNISSTANEIIDLSGNDFGQGVLSISYNYDPSIAAWDGTTELDLSSETTSPFASLFDGTGTQLYVLGQTEKEIYKYQLSTPYDVSTAQVTTDILDVSSQQDIPYGMSFNTDGTRFYLLGEPQSGQFNYVVQYNLSTAYDLSTGTISGSFDTFTGEGEAVPTDLQFNEDGSKAFILGHTNDRIYTYNLATNFEITSATYAGSAETYQIATNVIGENNQAFQFRPDGFELHILLPSAGRIYRYALSSSFDLSTINPSTLGFLNFNLANSTTDFIYNADGTVVYMLSDLQNAFFPLEITDTKNPLLTSIVKTDETTLTLTFDESVVVSAQNVGDFVVTDGAGNSYAVASIDDATLGDGEITLTTVDLSQALGDLIVTYSDANSTIIDITCNNFNSTSPGEVIDLDNIRPNLSVAGRTSNTELFVVFDEPVQIGNNIPGFFSVSDANNTTYAVSALGDAVPFDNEIELTVTDISTATQPLTITYAGSSSSGAIEDFGSNMALNGNILIDESGPSLLAAKVLSDSLTIRVFFSEPIVGSPVASDFQVSDCRGVAFTPSSIATVSGTTFDVTMSAHLSPVIGDILVAFDNNSITDLVGNVAVASNAEIVRLFTIENATSDNVSFNPAISNLSGFDFNNDGTKVVMGGLFSNSIEAFDLQSPFDLTTITATSSEQLTVSGSGAGMHFASDGTYLFVASYSSHRVYRYDLSVPYDLGSAVLNTSSLAHASPADVKLSNDGTKVIINSLQSVEATYELTTAYDLSTAVLISSREFASSFGFEFNDDGTKLLTLNSNRRINEYALTDPYDLNTAVFTNFDLPVSLGTGSTLSFRIVDGGEKLFVVSFTEMYQYTMGETQGPNLNAGQFVSSTEVSLTFDKPVAALGMNPSDFTLTDGVGATYAVSGIADGQARDEFIELTTADLSIAAGDLQVTYINNNNEVTDLLCNPLATNGQGVSIDTDQTVPTMVSGTLVAANQIELTYSEPVQLNTYANNFLVVDAFTQQFSVSGVTDGTSQDAKVLLDVDDLTIAVGDVTVTYEANGLIEDFGENGAPIDLTGLVVDADQSAPTLIAVDKASSTDLTLTFSELVQTTGLNASDFEVINDQNMALTVTGISDGTAQDDELILTLSNLDAVDNEVTVTYTGVNDVVSDFGGNAMAIDNIGIVADIVDPVIPLVSGITTDSGQSSSDGITNDNTLVFSGTAEENSQIELFVDGTSSTTTNADGAGEFSFDFTGSASLDGTYNITVTATDAAGNTSLASAPYTVIVDTEGPNVASINRLDQNGLVNNVTTVSYEVVFDEDVFGVDATDFELITNGGVTAIVGTVDLIDQRTYEVAIENISGSIGDSFGLNAKDDDSISDLAGNVLGGAGSGNGDFQGQVYSFKTPQTITFDQGLSGNIYGGADFSISAVASSGLSVSLTVTGPISINGSQITIIGAGEAAITATQAGDDEFASASEVVREFTIAKVPLTVTPDDQQIAFGETIPSLTFMYSGFIGSDDESVLNDVPTIGTIATSSSGTGTYDIVGSGGDDDNYSYSFSVATLTIAKADQTISFDPISDFDLASASTLDIGATTSSGLDIVYNLTTGDGTINEGSLKLNATGSFTIEATQPGNDNYNAAASIRQSFQVIDSRKSNQTITFDDDLSGLTYGDGTIVLTGSSTSQLDISYTTSGPISVTDETLTITGAGDVSVTATQSGNDDFNPAASVTIDFNIAKATLTATADDKTIAFGSDIPDLSVSLSGFAGEDTADNLDATPAVSTSATNTSDVGTYSIEVTGGSDDDYDFSYVAGTLTIEKATQTITFEAIDNFDISTTTTVTLAAFSNAGLDISYALQEGDGSISDNVLTVNNTGNFTVSASQLGNDNVEAATTITQSFQVTDAGKTDQAITFPDIQDAQYGDVITLSAIASSSLAVSYELISGGGLMDINELTITGIGSFEIRATQSGDATYNPAPSITLQFTVSKANLIARPIDIEVIEEEDLPAFEIAYSGLKLGEAIDVLDELPTASVNESGILGPGEYPILISGGADDHYEFDLQDGVLTVLTVLSTDFDPHFTMKVYPNPAIDRFLLEWNGEGPVSIRILDHGGIIQWTKESVRGKIEVDVSRFASGLYHVQLFDQGQLIGSQKLLVR